ncbi:hypothetical protein [Bradyrhizobium sp. STM 3561]|uniref:hypothetical protein n=1 Tax=Bradyrhizobium sp. STM 3561 TaxID=578923 RepID=UPI003890EC16
MAEFSFINGTFVKASASFTPSAASYTAGNIIDTAKEFVFADRLGRLVPPGSLIRMLSSIVKIDASAVISGEGAYTAHTYSVTPPSARANNTAWARASGDLSAYRGSLALGAPVAAGGTCYVKTQFTDSQDFELSGSSLFVELVNAGTFTAAAVARQIWLYGFIV